MVGVGVIKSISVSTLLKESEIMDVLLEVCCKDLEVLENVEKKKPALCGLFFVSKKLFLWQ